MNNHAGKKPTKRISVFDKRQVIGLHRAMKSARELPQMMAIRLKTVQRTIAQWKKMFVYLIDRGIAGSEA